MRKHDLLKTYCNVSNGHVLDKIFGGRGCKALMGHIYIYIYISYNNNKKKHLFLSSLTLRIYFSIRRLMQREVQQGAP